MKSTFNETNNLEIVDGLIIQRIQSSHLSVDHVKSIVENCKTFLDYWPMSVVFDISPATSIDRGIKDYLSSLDEGLSIKSCAIITRSSAVRTFTRLLIGMHTFPFPIEVFYNRKSGVKWAKSMENQKLQAVA